MILDSLLQFSDAQALTVTGAVSTNVIDLSNDRKIGIGEPMAAVVTIGVAADFTTTTGTQIARTPPRCSCKRALTTST